MFAFVHPTSEYVHRCCVVKQTFREDGDGAELASFARADSEDEDAENGGEGEAFRLLHRFQLNAF
jgi:hypothetical protein